MFRRTLTLALTLSVLAFGCSKHKVEIGREHPELEIQKCEKLAKKKRTQEAIDCFEIFKSRFADTAYGAQAELAIADNYFAQKEYLIAADSYQSFLKVNPTHPKADYAAYRTGLSYLKEAPRPIDRDQQYLNQAVSHFEFTLRNFPNSPYLETAKKDLAGAQTRLARRIFYIGRFYYRTGEYLAAIPRFEELDDDYPEAPTHIKSLYYLTLSHLKLGHSVEAALALSKMETIYPDNAWTKKAAKKVKKK